MESNDWIGKVVAVLKEEYSVEERAEIARRLKEEETKN